jgi:hypothetical protein
MPAAHAGGEVHGDWAVGSGPADTGHGGSAGWLIPAINAETVRSEILNTLKKTAGGTLLGAALLVGGGLGLAHAAPPAPEAQTAGDGVINVTVSANGQEVGVLRDITVTNAAALATSVCPAAGIDTNALTNLDVSGTVPVNPCSGATGLAFSFAQNVATAEGAHEGNSQYAPGQNKAPDATPPGATPTVAPGQQAQQDG